MTFVMINVRSLKNQQDICPRLPNYNRTFWLCNQTMSYDRLICETLEDNSFLFSGSSICAPMEMRLNWVKMGFLTSVLHFWFSFCLILVCSPEFFFLKLFLLLYVCHLFQYGSCISLFVLVPLGQRHWELNLCCQYHSIFYGRLIVLGQVTLFLYFCICVYAFIIFLDCFLNQSSKNQRSHQLS